MIMESFVDFDSYENWQRDQKLMLSNYTKKDITQYLLIIWTKNS